MNHKIIFKEIPRNDIRRTIEIACYLGCIKIGSLELEDCVEHGRMVKRKIWDFRVCWSYRCKGYGSAILEYTLKKYNDYPIELGACPFDDSPLSLKQTIDFYKKFGFVELDNYNFYSIMRLEKKQI